MMASYQSVVVLSFCLVAVHSANLMPTARTTTPNPTMLSSSSLGSPIDMKDGLMSDSEEMMNIVKECNTTFQVPLEHLQHLNKTGEFPADANDAARCYIRCMLEKQGVMSDSGTLDVQNAKKVLQDGTNIRVADGMMETCSSKSAEMSNLCERAYTFASCLLMEDMDRNKQTTTSKMTY